MINESQAKKYCKEDISKIENYDKAIADTTQMWICHHRTAIWWNCTRKELKDNECYYDRKACELIFVTKAEHRKLHGTNHSAETRKKMSEAMTGHAVSDETKRKLSESNKGHTPSNKGKPMSDEQKRKLSEAVKAYHAAKRKAGGK